MKKPLWKPYETEINNSNMSIFTKYLGEKTGNYFNNYDELYDWSVNNIYQFWEIIWNISDIIHSKNYNTIHIPTNDNDIIPRGKWFPGARLNFAENLLRYRDNRTAIIAQGEDAKLRSTSYAQLYRRVAEFASGLKKLGVQKNDRVAAFITNIPEAIIAMLAVSSIGALWSSCSPDFGFKGVLDRFGQIEPKVLIAVDSYSYNGKRFDCADKVMEITKSIDSLAKTIILPNGSGRDFNGERYSYWDEINDKCTSEIEFEQLPFDHPLYIMYSSGTTGKPKSIVHGSGGTLLQHIKELKLHTGISPDDKFMYFTTCGWMMWNWLVSGLSLGSTLVLVDGSPGFPDLRRLWKLVEDTEMTVFGTSPKFLSSCQKEGIVPAEEFNLSTLKTILSTGSPLTKENYNWVYESVKEDIRLSSISGGTDIISCFMLGNPNLPVYTEELQCRGLGMKVEAWNEKGEPVLNQKGELVCTAPFPSMPVCFWNDENNKKYSNSYYGYFPGVWRHGDYISINERGGVTIYGRSDATLNPGGVRIGTSEIYRIVEAMDQVKDSIAVGVPNNGDVAVALFVVLQDGYELDEKLKSDIRKEIRAKASPRHVPSFIENILEVPVTLNGKKVELAVQKIFTGEEITNRSALANPGSLEQFRKFRI